jgi:hypothetical protein
VPEELLNRYLDGTVAPGDFVLRYQIGDSFSGETRLQLRGDGTYDAFSTATAGRQRRSYSGQLPTDQVQALARALRDARVWEARHVRDKPREDDPPASLSVSAGGDDAGVTLWVSEIGRVPQFAAAQDAVLAMIRRISDDEVLESGR